MSEAHLTPGLVDAAPVRTVLSVVAEYGWWLVGGGVLFAWLASVLQPQVQSWRQAREDAAHHKNPDLALKRMEQIQRARERQQQELELQSALAKQTQKEREERKRAELAALLAGAGAAEAGANRLGGEHDYLPLSGGAGGSGYRPPKKSKCGGGGCGR